MSRRHALRAAEVVGWETAIAPHVAARIGELGELGLSELRGIAELLGPAACRGMTALPDPLPLPPEMLRRSRKESSGMGAAPRRLLLTAALSVTDRVDVLMAAAAVDAAVVLDRELVSRVVLADGRYRFVSARARAEAVATAAPREIAEAHRALARVCRLFALRGEEAWHTHQGHVRPDSPGSAPEPRPELLIYGNRLLHSGAVLAAYRVGDAVASSADPVVRARGLLLAGRAALAMGCFHDALVRLREASESAATRDAAAKAVRTTEGLLAGPEPTGDAVERVAEQARLLDGAAVTSADRAALRTINEINALWRSDTVQVDALQSLLVLSAQRSHPAWSWNTERVTLSPLTEGHVRGQHLGFQLILGDLPEAVAVFQDAALRLPMTHIGGGVMRSGLEAIRTHAQDLAAALRPSFEVIGPDRVVSYVPEPMALAIVPAVSKRYRSDGHRSMAASALEMLSAREREVAELLTRGLSNQDAGQRLRISSRTVEVHVGNVFRKLGVRTRVELVVLLAGGGALRDPVA